MYPTRTTSTTGTFRIPPAPPQAAAVRATGDLYPPALRPGPAPQPAPAPQPVLPTPAPSAADAPLPHPAQPTRPTTPAAAGAALSPTARPGQEAGLLSADDRPVSAAVAAAGATPAPHSARPVAAAVIPGPFEAPAESRAAAAQAVGSGADTWPSAGAAVAEPHPAQGGPGPAVPVRALGAVVGVEAEAPVRALGSEAGGPGAEAEAGVPGVDTGESASVPAGTVALPHGRPAVESAWSEVPAARIRVEPEPVHALAGAGERAESGGSPYGHEPEPLGSVPAPAAHPHAGVPTLRLRAEPAPPAGAGTQPPADAPARRYGAPAAPEPPAGTESGGRRDPQGTAPSAGVDRAGSEPAWQFPYVPQPHAEAAPGPAAGSHAQSAADASANRHDADTGPQEPHVPQPQPQPQPVQGGFRARLGQVWPLAGPGADGPAQRYGEPWPPAAPEGDPAPRAPYTPLAAHTPYVPQPHDGTGAESGHRAVELRTEDGDTEDLPQLAQGRGAAVTEVPVHLPFPAESRPAGAPATGAGHRATPAPAPATSPSPTPSPRIDRAAPGRRVPRGDERLREHRGPVLPGWVGVGVGALALTGCLAVLWRAGAVPAPFVAAFGATPRAYQGLRATHWPPLAFLGIVALLALGGLGRVRAGHAWVLTLFGRYRGTVRRTGLTWVSPLLLRRRVDVRLRHWRSEPMPAVDSGGLALRVVVQVVWQVKDTARATLAVEDHTEYLAEQVESAMARVLSQLPADAFHEDAPTLRDSEAVGDALTRMLATETEAVGIEVYSAQPTRIEYAPEVAEAMRRRRVAAIDAKHRDTVLTSVVDAVDDTVHRLTSRGLVELDDYERKALVKDLTVAFYTGRPE
ncbi:SPFH domain-containing protein [Streptomyces sp. NPDC051582]|uniref:SPFH domain-containing protein n=1 Tax=Streptomyces sp. NPDC051582 TaxID=3155167 RepID=UPI0034421E70